MIRLSEKTLKSDSVPQLKKFMSEVSVLVLQQIIQYTLTHVQAARYMEEPWKREEKHNYLTDAQGCLRHRIFILVFFQVQGSTIAHVKKAV